MDAGEQAYWDYYAEQTKQLDQDVRSARKIGKYKGNAVVLTADDPLSVEWAMYDELYG